MLKMLVRVLRKEALSKVKDRKVGTLHSPTPSPSHMHTKGSKTSAIKKCTLHYFDLTFSWIINIYSEKDTLE